MYHNIAPIVRYEEYEAYIAEIMLARKHSTAAQLRHARSSLQSPRTSWWTIVHQWGVNFRRRLERLAEPAEEGYIA
jgi:hypothetical protein